MKRVVVDTSVLISALIGREGPSREIIRQCLLGTLKPLISPALFLEYETVSERSHIRQLCPLTDGEIREFIAAFLAECEWVQIHYLWRPNLKDAGDNFLIELAVAGNAELVLTNNVRDLRNAELSFDNLDIASPHEYLTGG